eukprot:scpid65553/ scgid23744/ 
MAGRYVVTMPVQLHRCVSALLLVLLVTLFLCTGRSSAARIGVAGTAGSAGVADAGAGVASSVGAAGTTGAGANARHAASNGQIGVQAGEQRSDLHMRSGSPSPRLSTNSDSISSGSSNTTRQGINARNGAVPMNGNRLETPMPRSHSMRAAAGMPGDSRGRPDRPRTSSIAATTEHRPNQTSAEPTATPSLASRASTPAAATASASILPLLTQPGVCTKKETLCRKHRVYRCKPGKLPRLKLNRSCRRPCYVHGTEVPHLHRVTRCKGMQCYVCRCRNGEFLTCHKFSL